MMKDITLGQYFPGNSLIHRMDPRMKIVLTVLYVVILFSVSNRNIIGLAAAALLMVLITLLSRIPMKMVFRGVRPIIPIIIFTALINAFFVPGKTLFHYAFMTVTYEGISLALFMTIRIVFLIIGTSMMTYTTSPIALTDGLERLMSPLKRIHLPVHELSMMMTIALRFIPTLIEETDKIINAQKARGADFETGNLMRRMKALVPILIPLFVSAFRRAEELALAMDCRCYQGGEGRTRMKQLHLAAADFVAFAFESVFFAGVIVLNLFAPKLF